MYAPYPPPSPYYPPPPAAAAAPYRAEMAWPTPIVSVATPGLRWAYLATAVVATLCFVVGIVFIVVAAVHDVARERDAVYHHHTGFRSEDVPALAIAGFILIGLWGVAYFAKLVLGILWLHKRWTWLPPDQRYAKTWSSWITPGTAIGLLFVPYFQLYWMFVVNCGLCDAVDRLRTRYPTRTASPKSLAIASCVCHLVPGINLLVAPFVWFFYMRGVDVAMTEVSESIARTLPARV